MKSKAVFAVSAALILISTALMPSCSGKIPGPPASAEQGGTSNGSENAGFPDQLIPPISDQRVPGTETEALWGDTLDEPGTVTAPTPGTHDFIISRGMCAWGNTIFYPSYAGRHELHYQNVSRVREAGLPLYNDALSEGEGDPFGKMDRMFILVDEKATVENNGFPVILTAFSNYIVGENDGTPFMTYESTVGFFDTFRNKWTPILKTDELISQLALYEDTILFTVEVNSDKPDVIGRSICRIDRDGGGYERIIDDSGMLPLIGYADGGILYYLDQKTFGIRAYDLASGEDRELFSELDPTILCVGGGYIYYEAYKDHSSFTESQYFGRRRLDDIDSEEIIFDKTHGTIVDGVYYYTDGNASIYDALYSYDIETGEKKQVFDLGEYNLSHPENTVDKFLVSVTDTYMIFEIVYRNTQQYDHYTCLDLVTGKEWKIPY